MEVNNISTLLLNIKYIFSPNTSIYRHNILPLFYFALTLLFIIILINPIYSQPIPGYSIHFDGIRSVEQAVLLVQEAQKAGAGIINLIPPAMIWTNDSSRLILDKIFDESEKLGLYIIISRIDAAHPDGINHLYDDILSQMGSFSDETVTGIREYRATLGNRRYTQWMQDETKFYSKHYGNRNNLRGFTVGLFSDPFLARPGSLLQFNPRTKIYDIAQYTEPAKLWWQEWLIRNLGNLDRINREYQSEFKSIANIPIPHNEYDNRFGLSHRAYSDFILSINDWVIKNYLTNQAIWRENSPHPFLFVLDGATGEILANGRGAFALLDIAHWLYLSDAIGINLYTDLSLDDYGLGGLQQTLNLAAFQNELGKPIYILTSGIRGLTRDTGRYIKEITFRIGLPYQPRTYIYEYFHERNVRTTPNPRFLLNTQGKPIEPNYNLIKNLFSELTGKSTKRLSPYLYLIASPRTIRNDSTAAKFYQMIHSTGSVIPLRWVNHTEIAFIPSNSLVLLAPSWRNPLSDIFQRDLITLAKRRNWYLILDTENYPSIRTKLGNELNGATIDLSGFLQSVKLTSAGWGLGKALVEFYETEFDNKPNGVSPDIGLITIPFKNGIWINLDQPADGKLELDLTRWKLTELNYFQFTVSQRDGQATLLSIKPGIDLNAIRMETFNPRTNKMEPVRFKIVNDKIELNADHLREYRIIPSRN